MNQRRQYLILIGIGLLSIAILILLISPDFIFSPTVTVIGSDLNKSTEDQVKITTKTDFGNEAQMAAFPRDIGKWHGRDFDTTETARVLNAPVVILIGYQPETFTQPLFLTIVQSKTNSSFHTLEGCLGLQGYQFQEHSKDSLAMTNPEWTQNGAAISIPLNKLVATKNNKDGAISERSLILYFYVKGNQFYTDTITLVEVQGLIPLSGSYEGTMSEEKAFLSQILPIMFQPRSNEESPAVINTLAAKGWLGYTGIIIILLIPVAVMVYPFWRRKDNNQ